MVLWSRVNFQFLRVFPVLGRPTNLDKSRARVHCACSLVYRFSFLSPALWETARYRLKYCLKGPLTLKTTNQPTNRMCRFTIEFFLLFTRSLYEIRYPPKFVTKKLLGKVSARRPKSLLEPVMSSHPSANITGLGFGASLVCSVGAVVWTFWG